MLVLMLEQMKASHHAFRERTSNAALAVAICVVCAQEIMADEGEKHNLLDIPHIQSLPAIPCCLS